MRRIIALAAACAAAAVLAAVPASAAVNVRTSVSTQTATDPDGEWIPVPSEPFDQAAGVTCDFPIHAEPVVASVVRMVLQTYPDGSVKREIYTGALIFQITNITTGASVEADASGTSVIDYKPGGSFDRHSTWHVAGPVLIGFRENAGNLPRGMYILNGIFTLTFSETGQKTVKWKVDGGAHNICEDL